MNFFKEIKHAFHADVLKMIPTGEWKIEHTPFDMFGTRYDEYICFCGVREWLPPLTMFDLQMRSMIMNATIEVAEAWRKRGNMENAIAVLQGKDVSN